MYKLIKNRNFSILLLGKSCSLFGTLVLNIVLALFVLTLGGTAADFALVLSSSSLPYILFSPIAGTLADRVNKKMLLITLDVVRAVWAICLLFLLKAGYSTLSLIYITGFIFTVCETFLHPTALSLLPVIAGEEDLVDANAMWGVADQGIAIGAPVLGAALYALLGMDIMLVGLCIIYSFAALIQVRLSNHFFQNAGQGKGFSIKEFASDFVAVLKTFSKSIPMSSLTFNGFLSHFFLLPFLMIGLPFMILRLLKGAPTEFGIVEGSAAVGSVLAAFFVSRCKHRKLANNLLIGMSGILIPVSLYSLLLVPPFFALIQAHPVLRLVYFCTLSFLVFVSFAFYGGYFGVFFQSELPRGMIARGYSLIIMTNGTGRLLGFYVFGKLFDAGFGWALLALAIGIILKIITHIPFMRYYGKPIAGAGVST